MTTKLLKDVRELLQAFQRWQVQYLVIGGDGVGIARLQEETKDFYFLTNPTPENSARVFSALREIGTPVSNTSEASFTHKQCNIVVDSHPNNIHIMPTIPGADFDTCWRRRLSHDIEGQRTNIISFEDLVAVRSAAGKSQAITSLEKPPNDFEPE